MAAPITINKSKLCLKWYFLALCKTEKQLFVKGICIILTCQTHGNIKHMFTYAVFKTLTFVKGNINKF